MWLGAGRAGTIENALGRNWTVAEQRKAEEGCVWEPSTPGRWQEGGVGNTKECFKARNPEGGVIPRLAGRWEESCLYRGHLTYLDQGLWFQGR